jgi:pimeloyl-ACP methyl ester carboxylesterase
VTTSLLPTSDPEPRVFNWDDAALAYADEGPRSAPALLAVHGIPGSHRDFRYLAPQLAPDVRLVRVDLPGFGGSAPAHDAVASLDGRARALLALADHLGLDGFSVLGHSMGGATALVLAAEHRARVRGLALVSSVALSPHRGLGMPPRAFALLARALRVPGLSWPLTALARAAYRRRRFPGADTLDAATLGLQMQAIAAVDFPRLRRAVAGGLPPTLLAWALDDHLVQERVSRDLADAIPGARRVVFETGGHNLQKSRAVELGRALREWIGAGP